MTIREDSAMEMEIDESAMEMETDGSVMVMKRMTSQWK